LNPHFAAWRTGLEQDTRVVVATGTFDWLVAVYKASPQYTKLPLKTRQSYDNALAMVSGHKLKDDRSFGTLLVQSITPGAADKLFTKLRVKSNGGLRVRSAVLAMVVAKTAWNTAWRSHPTIPVANPFAKMKLEYEPTPTRPPTHEELLRLVAAADAAGEWSIGTAAMIAFYWLQREVDILRRFSWTHYRPTENSGVVKVLHHKTRKEVDLPLFDDDETPLWPELMSRLDKGPHHGILVVTRDKPDRSKKVRLPWKEDYFRHTFSEIRTAAAIDPEVKFMGLRHGGNTEGANAGLSDAQLRALSGHKSADIILKYAQPTLEQRRTAARKRRDARVKKTS